MCTSMPSHICAIPWECDQYRSIMQSTYHSNVDHGGAWALASLSTTFRLISTGFTDPSSWHIIDAHLIQTKGIWFHGTWFINRTFNIFSLHCLLTEMGNRFCLDFTTSIFKLVFMENINESLSGAVTIDLKKLSKKKDGTELAVQISHLRKDST